MNTDPNAPKPIDSISQFGTPGANAIQRHRASKPNPYGAKPRIHHGTKPAINPGTIPPMPPDKTMANRPKDRQMARKNMEYDYEPSYIPPPTRQPTITNPRR